MDGRGSQTIDTAVVGVQPSVRNEKAFLLTVVGSTSAIATVAGFLPGDWVPFPWLLDSALMLLDVMRWPHVLVSAHHGACTHPLPWHELMRIQFEYT